MARSGDFVTPELWGKPWFEKPPLLYWMTAAGTRAGLNAELSGRVPVALLSVAFLIVTFFFLRGEFGFEAAQLSVLLLATSVSWLAYSNLCLTDIPLAVFFSLAVWLALPLLRAEPRTSGVLLRMFAIGACIGMAALAKGLVPMALMLPSVWFLRRVWKTWWAAVLGCVLLAGPWYVAVYRRNGFAFVEQFFLRHHLARLYSPSLQHVQPFYYYVPILLLAVFPWTPLFFAPPEDRAAAASREKTDLRSWFLLSVAAWGFVFFSASLNKLPGYLLPLLPALFAWAGPRCAAVPLHRHSRRWFLSCAVLIALIPGIAVILPQAVVTGRIHLSWLLHWNKVETFFIALPICVAALARRSWAMPLLVLCVVGEGFYLKRVSLPALDRVASARTLWKQIAPTASDICDGGTNRDWLYGLSFYRGASFVPCASGGSFGYVLRSQDHELPTISPRPDH